MKKIEWLILIGSLMQLTGALVLLLSVILHYGYNWNIVGLALLIFGLICKNVALDIENDVLKELLKEEQWKSENNVR